MSKYDDELKRKFKQSFGDIRLSEDRLDKINKSLRAEEEYRNTKLGKVKVFLNKEIEIDIKRIGIASVIFFIISTSFSIKGLEELPQPNINIELTEK